MSLINCPECGKEISERALSCPHCGFPIQNTSSEDVGGSSANGDAFEGDSKPTKRKILVPIILSVVGLLIVAVVFFLLNRPPSVSDEFNKELEESLAFVNLKDDGAFSVSGSYGSVITHTTDFGFAEMIAETENEDDAFLLKNFNYSLIPYICSTYFMDRLELLDEKLSLDEQYDENIDVARDVSEAIASDPTCIINEGADVFEFSVGADGEYSLKVNGGVFKINDFP